MKIKFNRNSWYMKMLGEPEHWCSLLWALVWRAGVVFIGYWVLYLLAVGNYHMFFAEESSRIGEGRNTGWVACGVILDIIVAYVIFIFSVIQRREIKAWMNEHCPKLEYEDE